MLLSGDLDSIFGQVLMMCETVANQNKEVQIQTVPPHALSLCVSAHHRLSRRLQCSLFELGCLESV